MNVGQTLGPVSTSLQPLVAEITEAITDKLWHELLCASLTLALDPSFTNPTALWQIISPYKHHVNARQLARLLIVTAFRSSTDAAMQLQAIKQHASLSEFDADPSARLLLDLVQAELGLAQNVALPKNFQKQMEGVERDTHLMALFYRIQSTSAAMHEQYAVFVSSSLLYLACETALVSQAAEASEADVFTKQYARPDLGLGGKEDDKTSRAYGLALASLLSESMYNFGQLVLHPIFSMLQGQHQWLVDLIHAFNAGDIARFDQLKKSIKDEQLLKNMTVLEQKIRLMALIEAVFRRSNVQRGAMSFVEISQETQVPLEQVEYLIMRALSLGLIKGKMDGLNGSLSATWISPRVLDVTQRKALHARLVDWQERVTNTSTTIQQIGSQIWVN